MSSEEDLYIVRVESRGPRIYVKDYFDLFGRELKLTNSPEEARTWKAMEAERVKAVIYVDFGLASGLVKCVRHITFEDPDDSLH
jgi:hypothetical protein